MSGFYDKSELEKTQVKIRATATPNQLTVMDAVQVEIDKANADLDERLVYETKLKDWAKQLTGETLHISAIEELQMKLASLSPGKVFFFRGTPLIKTMFGHVDNVENYIKVLEATTINVTNNSQFTALPFFDLIKLAFKRLFTRRERDNGK